MSAQPIRHVILDRDGVLNREAGAGGYVREPGEFHWLPGALEGLALLRQAGIRLSVATNQSGIGRGLMTLADLAAVHQHMQAEAAAHGATLDAILVCPHAPDEHCDCRKPAPGLISAAVARSGLAPEVSLVVGDDERDLEAARRAGVAAALVRTGKGRQTELQVRSRGIPTYDDLAMLARAITGREAAPGARLEPQKDRSAT